MMPNWGSGVVCVVCVCLGGKERGEREKGGFLVPKGETDPISILSAPHINKCEYIDKIVFDTINTYIANYVYCPSPL